MVATRLGEHVETLPPRLAEVCRGVVHDVDFLCGYGANKHHHDYPGGLAVHTLEVVEYCMAVALGNPSIDREVLLTAAIWHDYLKTRDYEVDATGDPQYTQYKKHIYHISGSAMEFYHKARLAELGDDFIDAVAHCILSHHGRPEWGSAVQPQTPEAWTLHYADCMSAWFENGGYKEKNDTTLFP